jgi:UDP-N-acetylglucosamine--N-acetylmuramyl-(pentapeptide) pyrophosphoryl-undecaprenol N-acetylglucosamine transferase
MSLHIVLTGGGTAGHVTPNLALISALTQAGYTIEYFGSKNGIEKDLVGSRNIPYKEISCGKLRRYFSWQNFIDPFKMLFGIIQAYCLFFKSKPDVIFSKGGFVALPVVIAAWLKGIPVVAHESDLSPGLANRLSFPFVKIICVTFAAAKKHFKNPEKVQVTGTPLRAELLQGSRAHGLQICGFTSNLPCLLIMGGGQGSRIINQCIRDGLPELIKKFQIVHLCGRGNIDSKYISHTGYVQIEYADQDLPDLLAASDVIISRSGANSLYEILALGKPHILIPLSAKASRGDQIQNANYFKQQGISNVINEEDLMPKILDQTLDLILRDQQQIIHKIKQLNITSATNRIIEILTAQIDHKSI